MSLRSKRTSSAFAVFKARKATSLSNMNSNMTTPKLGKKSKSASANTTPTSTKDSSLSSVGSNTDKKKKLEMKKIKKLLKSASKKRSSFLPDQALDSPLIATMNGNVELRSMRPKASIINAVPYSLPLRATPDASRLKPPLPDWGINLSDNLGTTPPLPPKAIVTPSMSVSPRHKDKSGQKRRNVLQKDYVHKVPDLPPRLPANAKQVRGLASPPLGEEGDAVPPRPTKRRRLSQGNVPSSPPKNSTLLSITATPDTTRERKESIPAHPKELSALQPYMFDSQEEARRLFECLIYPVVPQKFFTELWEKKPLLVKRHQPDYNDGWFSTAELDRILREENIKFGENLDVVSYENGKRETHNAEGRAYSAVVWDYYQNGCSARLLNPQTYSKTVWKLLSILQEYFGCCVGANVYLTPPGTQGFAPHWDDIEAFILQLEGKKHWKLYSPRTEGEALPRYSSGNFTDEDIGKPILDAILEAGDLLYFPRGTIHQGCSLPDEHSLHITVSCYQKNTWGDVMERLIPQALQVALNEDIEFRKALPKDYLNYMGVAFSDQNSPERQNFIRHIEQLMCKLLTYAPVDSACDQMGKKYIEDSLPPVLTEAEKYCSIHGQGERWDPVQKRVVHSVELDAETSIKLIRRGCVRLVTEEDQVCIYHNMENARVYHGAPMQCVEITADMAPAMEYLLKSYPDFVTINCLPLDDFDDRAQLVSLLYDKGLIITQEPLEPLSDGDSAFDISETQVLSVKPTRKASMKK